MLSYKYKLVLLSFVTLIGIILVFFISPIPQNPNYHYFSDSRMLLSIPNFFNVISNLPFIFFGGLGIFICIYFRERNEPDLMLAQNLCFFIGILLTGLGSSFYHLYPCTDSLVFDRIPMTITFMAFFSILISDYINTSLGKNLLFHLITLGIFSVIYWYKTEQDQHGDLRFYALVQFLPMILTPIVLILFRNEGRFSIFYWCIIGVYVVAKILELNDHEIYLFTTCISGHSLKHLFASLVPFIYFLKLWYEKVLNRV